jgi:hypothetical protein
LFVSILALVSGEDYDLLIKLNILPCQVVQQARFPCADASQGGLPWREVPAYIAAQVFGAFLGDCAYHVRITIVFASNHARSRFTQSLREFVATFGLLAVIWAAFEFALQQYHLRWAHISLLPMGSASTSFANPAVTLAPSASDTFAGVRPVDVPTFIVTVCQPLAHDSGSSRTLRSGALFTEEANRLRVAIGQYVLAVEHVGSTAKQAVGGSTRL